MPFKILQTLRLAVSAAAVFILAACTTDSDAHMPAQEPVSTADAHADESVVASENEIDEAIVSVDNRVAEEDAEPGPDAVVGDEISHASTGQIPMELNADVERWIAYFTGRDKERFLRFLSRGEKYKPMITAVLRDQGVPTEIYYQAMIESGFSTHATSHASAVGIWQFINGTGRRYGLRVDSYVDERRDPMRATIAAAIYLKDLYNVFNSWYLAMAAYNAGEGRIMGAIMRAKTRDFWEMVRGRALPAETLEYIPKFIAATMIGHNPAKYGMDAFVPLEADDDVIPSLVSVSVAAPVRLSDISDVSGVPLAILKDANPHLLRDQTPPGASEYRLWVPRAHVDSVESQTRRIAEFRMRPRRDEPVALVAEAGVPAKPRIHRVGRGETLASIAKTYGLTVPEIKRVNNMRSGRITAGQRLKVGTIETVAFNPQHYRVKRGDNLQSVARRFGISVVELKRLNSLKRNKIYVGQSLKVGTKKG